MDSVDSILDEFEERCRQGDFPEIDEFLPLVSDDEQSTLVYELTRIEWHFRRRHLRPRSHEEFCTRYSEFSDSIQQALDEEKIWEHSENIERFEIRRLLGRGGFGEVVLGFDPKLNREVAIKIARRDRPLDEDTKSDFLDEARAVSHLQHPSIIQVYDYGLDSSGYPYVVMEYVEGQTLQEHISKTKLTVAQAVKFSMQITECLQYAHAASVVHRDLKPANILLLDDGRIKIADFGLALHDNAPLTRIRGRRGGTLPYMPPEQLRGENHRLNVRSDIWSLGIILYRLLTGKRPFHANSVDSLLDEIANYSFPLPSQLVPHIPIQLERICLKCLAPLMKDRYKSAALLLQDLRTLAKSLPSSDFDVGQHDIGAEAESTNSSRISNLAARLESQPLAIVPKGLRSFDVTDHGFFLSLLPGPVDRDGVPDSIRFWMDFYTHQDRPYGLLYGPSGCGKSSFVKAGLAPMLGPEIHPVYVECTRDSTAQQISNQIKRQSPFADSLDSTLLAGSEQELGTARLLYQIRKRSKSRHGKLLIILDQFEQWLHDHARSEKSEVLSALRQCDGKQISCLFLVRDDYWMDTQSLFEQLETPIQEDQNAAALPLFNRRHARQVLKAFGFAYGGFHDLEQDGNQTRQFLDRAVEELVHKERVICAHLALFADMLQGKAWTVDQLKRIGGWAGASEAFLEQNFGEHARFPSRALNSQLIQALLRNLIPDHGEEIKAASQNLTEIYNATAETLPNVTTWEIDSAIEFLDGQKRLISRSEEIGDTQGYQLAHDIMVNPIRQWLDKKQLATWQGRAQLKLESLSKAWDQTSDRRHLPSPLNYLAIQAGVNRQTRNQLQNRMMQAANRYYLVVTIAISLFLTTLGWGYAQIQNSNNTRLIQQQIESFYGTDQSASPIFLKPILEHADLARSIVSRQDTTKLSRRAQLRHRLLEAHLSLETDLESLLDFVPDCKENECANFVMALRHISDHLDEKSWEDSISRRLEIESNSSFEDLKSRARLALIAAFLGNTSFLEEILQPENTTLRTVLTMELGEWNPGIRETVSLARQFANDPDKEQIFLNGIAEIEAYVADESIRSDVTRYYSDRLTSPSCRVHSAAQLGLSRWTDQWHHSEIAKAPPDADWREFEIADEIMCFVRIPAGLVEAKRKGVTTRLDVQSCWVNTKEVSFELFREFALANEVSTKTLDYVKNNSNRFAGQDFPVGKVTVHEAMDFCNWLSNRYGLTPAYGVDKTSDEIRKVYPDANGFRICGFGEWELACRGDSTTPYFLGDYNTSIYLDKFAWCTNSKFPVQGVELGPRGRKLPNDHGIFDILGNTNEWTQNTPFPNGEYNYQHRGGDGGSPLRFFRYDSWVVSSLKFPLAGLRLAVNDIAEIERAMTKRKPPQKQEGR